MAIASIDLDYKKALLTGKLSCGFPLAFAEATTFDAV